MNDPQLEFNEFEPILRRMVQRQATWQRSQSGRRKELAQHAKLSDWIPLPYQVYVMPIQQLTHESLGAFLDVFVNDIIIPAIVDRNGLESSFDVCGLCSIVGGPPWSMVMALPDSQILQRVNDVYPNALTAELKSKAVYEELRAKGIRRSILLNDGAALDNRGKGLMPNGTCFPMHVFFDHTENRMLVYNLGQISAPNNFIAFGCTTVSEVHNCLGAFDYLLRTNPAQATYIRQAATTTNPVGNIERGCKEQLLRGWAPHKMEVHCADPEVWRWVDG
jgi:hypothetical protein